MIAVESASEPATTITIDTSTRSTVVDDDDDMVDGDEEVLSDFDEDMSDDEEEEEDESDNEEDKADDEGFNRRSMLSRQQSRNILDLLTRVESSRKLTNNILLRKERTSSSVTTSSLTDDEDTYSTSSGISLRDSEPVIPIVQASTSSDSRDSNNGGVNVEDLMLRVDTFHRSTRSFLTTTDAMAETTTTPSSSSSTTTPSNSIKSSPGSDLETPKGAGSPDSSSSSSSPSSTSSLDDAIAKARQELQALRDQGESTRQHHEEQLETAQARYDSASTAFSQAMEKHQDTTRNPTAESAAIQLQYMSVMKESYTNSSGDDDKKPLPSTDILKLQASLLQTLYTSLVIHPNQVEMQQDFMISIDKAFLKESNKLRHRKRKSQDALHNDLAKATSRNFVLYDFYNSKVSRQQTEINACRTKLGLPPIIEKESKQDDDSSRSNKNGNNSTTDMKRSFDKWARSSLSMLKLNMLQGLKEEQASREESNDETAKKSSSSSFDAWGMSSISKWTKDWRLESIKENVTTSTAGSNDHAEPSALTIPEEEETSTAAETS